jgi:hypothetical protein
MQGRPSTRALGFARLLSSGAACLLAAVALLPSRATAAPAGALSMNPTNTAIDVGDTVSITFDLSGGLDVHSVHIGVTYNASVLQAVDADAGASGVQVLPGPFPGDDLVGVVLTNSVSGGPGSGIINYQYELDGAAEVSGDGTVATVQFVGIAPGNANLSWSTRQIRDANDVLTTPSASAAIVVVGNVAPPPTDTPGPTDTPAPSVTPTLTPAASTTSSVTPTRTPTATPGTATATKTAVPTKTPRSTSTPRATSTARITVLENSNQPRSSGGVGGRTIGVDPSQTDRANGLPDAGNNGPGVRWWKWTFFAAALMLALAGWFFTFAVHFGDRDVVLMDRFDARRRRINGRKLPPR